MPNIILGKKVVADIELFVFDKDGTIIDLYNYWFHMVELRAKKICEFYKLSFGEHQAGLMSAMGVDIRRKRINPNGPVGLRPREEVQEAAQDYLLGIPVYSQRMPDVCSALFKEADDMSLRLLGKFIKPLDGAVGLLKKIKTKGGKIAVATSDRTQRAMLAMKFLKIDKVVDLVVGTDKVEVTKPAPDMLKFIASHFKVTTDRSCIVGDALTDIQMGLNAGFKASIAVLGGVSRKEELKKLTPYVIKNISCMDVA